MRQWDKQPEKPQVKALIDRRQIILGALTLLGMALLLIVGLTPRGASAPEPDAAQAGQDSTLTLAENCAMVQHLTYTPCGHAMTRRQTLPPDLNGKTRADLEAAYDGWQVTSFSATEVDMERSLDMYCPEHMILMPDESGMLCVFQNKYGDALALVEALDIPISDLPDSYQEEIRPGKAFDNQDLLSQWLEAADS
ncbi:MAG: hypothetical protein E7316_10820 [Clostridiales bacterium]|nr:hypothetical protein [Clostridiales bacterium]